MVVCNPSFRPVAWRFVFTSILLLHMSVDLLWLVILKKEVRLLEVVSSDEEPTVGETSDPEFDQEDDMLEENRLV